MSITKKQNVIENGKKRKKGETLRNVLCFLQQDPIISVKAMAKSVGVGEETINAKLRQIRKKPSISIKFGIQEEEVTRAISVRYQEKERRRSKKQKKAKKLCHGDRCPQHLQGVWPDDPRWPKDVNGRPLQLLGWDSYPRRKYFASGLTSMGYADPEYSSKPEEFRKSSEKSNINLAIMMREKWS